MTPIVIIEDDEKIRNYLGALLAGSGEFNLKASFINTEEVMEYFEAGLGDDIELVLTDIQLPGKSGIELIAWLKPRRPDIQFMVLSVYDDADKVFKALQAGASGYVLKNTSSNKLIESLIDLQKGGSPMSSQIARKVVLAFQQQTPYVDAKDSLSDRENEVLAWLSKGYSYQEIADHLFIAIDTVRTHIRNLYEKLHVRNKKEALRKTGLR
ncbi:response regulator transcription factor [Mucilaginibacter sp.]|uniref:response regulator transcription factor n=1 Tax=Mucilaginibacter sp. TaxID=1882438 RepID=UPI00284683DF|nr:response regulator transcription factor [Mucilaginibacter sp.]MDR3696656.1 response regulator transcription factor [Mucilaginibacter sp.]